MTEPLPESFGPCHAAIFDLDGTLLDTLEDLAVSANAMLEARGYPTHPIDAYRTFVGNGMPTLVRRILPESESADEALCAEALEEFQAFYREGWNRRTRPYPGIGELLAQLVATEIRLAVLSNKRHAFTQLCIDAYCGDIPWRAVLGQREDVPRKPDPAGALEAASACGVPPERCAFVGDTSVDMQTAVNAGMLPVGVTWGFRERGELIESGARLLIDRPEEMLDRVTFVPASNAASAST